METILVFDGNSILNRAFYGVRPLTAPDGMPTNAIFGFVNILLKNVETVSPTAVAVAFDLPAPTFRHKACETYKANRKGMPEELAVQLPVAKEICAHLGYTVATRPTTCSAPLLRPPNGTATTVCSSPATATAFSLCLRT